MASVGTAYVSIRVDTKGFEKSLDSMLARLSAKMETAGTKMGNDLTKGLKKTDWNSGFSGLASAADKAGKDAVRSLDQVENKVISLAHYSSDAGSSMADDFHKVGDAARDAKGDVGDLSKELTGAKRASRGIDFGGVGGGSGALRTAAGDAGFFSSKLRELDSEADKGKALLHGLFNAAAFGGTALAALAGGASAAVQGLGAIAANAIAMLPALSAATTGIIGLAQVAATLGLSFAGVGNAIGAGMKAVTAVNPATTAAATGTKKLGVEMQKMVKPAKVSRDAILSAKEAAKEAAKGITEAKDDLKRAYRDVAWSAKDAAEQTADAEADLADAQGGTLEAQQALNDARAEAIEQLEDIAFKAEDAALGEERAGLKLEDAYAKLLEVSQLAPDDKARREAELAYKEAELGLRQARDAREDADAEAAQAAETGIEGTEAMQSAREDLASAQENEAQATRDLADARNEEARNTIENAEQILDAENAVIDARNRHRKALADVAEAQADYAAAVKAANAAAAEQNANAREANARAREAAAAAAAQVPALTAVQKAYDAYAQALKDMSPAQRTFVERIVGMRDEFIKFRQQLAEPIFQSLNSGLTKIIDGGLLDVLKKGLLGTSDAIADVIDNNRKGMDSFGELAESPAFQTSLGDVMKSNNESMKHFGRAGVNLADAFVQVADAASPLLEDLSKWVEHITRGWSETARAKNATGELTKTFETAADRVREFWGLGKELWRTLDILGESANKAANRFGDMGRKGEEAKDKFGYITSLTDSLRDFNDKLDKTPGKVAGFTQALETLNAMGRALKNVIIDPLTKLGQDPAFAEAFDKLAKTDAFDRMAKSAGKAAPLLADIAVNVADILAAMSESGAIEHFLEILKNVTKWLAIMVGWMADKGILKWTGYVTGALAAIRLLWAAFKIGASPFVGLTKGLSRFIGGVALAKAEGKGLFGSLKSGVAGVFKGKGFGKAGAAAGSAGALDSDAGIITAIEGAATRIVLAIEECCFKMTAAMGRAGAAGGAGALSAAPRGAAGAAGGVAAGAAGAVGKVGKFSKVFGALGAGVSLLGGPLGIILLLLPLLIPLFVKLEEKFGIFSKTLDGVKWALGKVGDFFVFLWDKMKELFGWVKDNWGTILIILTGPIGLAVSQIIKHWDDIKAAVGTAVDFVKGLLGKIWNGITEGLTWAWNAAQATWNNVVGWIQGLPAQVSGFLSGIWDSLKTGLTNAWNWVVEKWGNIVDYIKGRPAQFVENLKTIWDVLKDKLGAAWDWVTTKWSNIVTWVKGRPAQFMENMSALWNVITEKLGDAWTWVIGKWGDIKDTVSGWAGQLTTKLGDLWGGFKDKLIEAWAWVVGKWDDIKTAIGKWPGDISDKLKNIWNGLGSGLVSALNWVGTKVNWMIDKLNGILDKFGGGKIEVSWPQLEWTGFAGGGPVRGPGGPKGDRIPARLSDGEHVLTASEVRAMGGHRNVQALRQAALRGDLPSGGLFGSILDKFKDVTSALGKGVEYAVKWVVGNVVDQLPDNMVGNMARGFIEKAADAIVSWGKKKDEEAAAAAQAGGTSAGAYHGPPGGWTYPLTRRYSAYNFPGHSPSWAVDIGAPGGTPVRAASAGKIITVRDLGNTSYGQYMEISHAGGVVTLYAHLSKFLKGAGSIVKTGELIGYSGNTGGVRGASGGYHLHFELKPSSSTIAAMAARGVPMARGGVVAPSRLGTLATLAEAGRAERVTPLDREGFTPSERKMIELLETRLGAGGGGDTYQIHPSAKVDEASLADLVARRVSWNRRRGVGSR